MVDFDRMPCVYWSDTTKIGYLQRYIIIHSIIYYQLGHSVISDKEFDSAAYQLVDMQKQIGRRKLKDTMYYYCMHDFDGSTGFDLYDRLIPFDKKYLTQIASHVLSLYDGGK